MMSNWQEEYLLALGVRDAHEQANAAIYDAYTRLADRTSNAHSSSSPTRPAGSPAGNIHENNSRKLAPSSKRQHGSETSPPNDALLAAARQDLSEAQRSRTELLDKLAKTSAELEKLQRKTKANARSIEELSAEKALLQTRVKDRDEELRGKAKLLDNVQTELVSLNLQFNMAEDRAKRLEAENKELVDRWMARMGQEADAMNKASKFS
ncbi:autophagy protein [Histoplasma ohiense]|nr:autophagy protein [Histoplasma ohiense (nom. inval.)]